MLPLRLYRHGERLINTGSRARGNPITGASMHTKRKLTMAEKKSKSFLSRHRSAHLFDEAHKAAAKPPGLVTVALQ